MTPKQWPGEGMKNLIIAIPIQELNLAVHNSGKHWN